MFQKINDFVLHVRDFVVAHHGLAIAFGAGALFGAIFL